jgi:hypothetical protein
MQYFSLSESKSAVDKMAVLSADQLKDEMHSKAFLPVTFEATCIAISKQTKLPMPAVPSALFKEPLAVRKAALGLGVSTIVENFHNENSLALAFFAQNRTAQSHFRFESVGGVKDSLPTVKSRVSLLADLAFISREKQPEQAGPTHDERQFIDLVKSIKRSLNTAVVEKRMPLAMAKEFSVQIVDAAVQDQKGPFKGFVNGLITIANDEIAQAERQKLIEKFRAPAKPSNTASPE